MSRLALARQYGAHPNNPRYAWSYVNHVDRLVIFGAWEHLETHEQQLIFSNTWRTNPRGRKNNSFMPSLRHIEHIIEDGYELRTFRQYGVSRVGGDLIGIKKFDKKVERKQLAVLGDDYFAIEVGAELSSETEAQTVTPPEFWEGTKFDVLQTRYERNQAARAACLEEFGHDCKVCGFNFTDKFGEIANEFIHVHHLVPVSERKSQYRVNPLTDLIPVCPNCHAMLHKRTPPYSVNELKEIILDLVTVRKP